MKGPPPGARAPVSDELGSRLERVVVGEGAQVWQLLFGRLPGPRERLLRELRQAWRRRRFYQAMVVGFPMTAEGSLRLQREEEARVREMVKQAREMVK